MYIKGIFFFFFFLQFDSFESFVNRAFPGGRHFET